MCFEREHVIFFEISPVDRKMAHEYTVNEPKAGNDPLIRDTLTKTDRPTL